MWTTMIIVQILRIPYPLAFSRDSCYTIVSGIPKVQIQSANFALWNLPNWYPTFFQERRKAIDLFPKTYKQQNSAL